MVPDNTVIHLVETAKEVAAYLLIAGFLTRAKVLREAAQAVEAEMDAYYRDMEAEAVKDGDK